MKTTSCVFILGMHRSGTSALAGMLRQYGLHLGEVRQANRFNAKGNQENPVVNRINNHLLLRHGGSWRQPAPVKTISFFNAVQIYYLRHKMAGKGLPWGIKDPRMLFCLSAWFKPGDKLAGIFRHPSEVVQSLACRHTNAQNPFPPAYWEALWCRYNRQLIRQYEMQPFPVVDFNGDASRYHAIVAALARTLGLKGKDEDFFDKSLKHHTERETDMLQPDTKQIYRRLQNLAQQEEKKLTEIPER